MSASVDLTAKFPRVNGAQLAAHVGQTVSLAGRVVAAGAGYTVEAADKATVRVLQGPAFSDHVEAGKVVEFTGMVTSPTEVTAYNASTLSDNFDLDNYNELVALVHGAHKGTVF